MSGNDYILGNAGNDIINAGAGNDWIDGGEGDDWVEAIAGDDIINGGMGRDSLYAGSGLDTFILTPSFGVDTIYRFNTGVDMFGLTNLTFEDLKISQGTGSNVNNTLISLKDTDELLASLDGISANSITSANFTLM